MSAPSAGAVYFLSVPRRACEPGVFDVRERKARNVSAIYTRPRFNPTGLQSLLAFPPFGGEPSLGYNTEGDVLVNTTADGVDVNRLWEEVQSVLQAWNAERGAVANLLSHYTINAADAVPQSIADESFEVASEFGEPESLRAPSNAILLGNTLVDYDKAGRFTWKFLRDSTAEQIRAVTKLRRGRGQQACQRAHRQPHVQPGTADQRVRPHLLPAVEC
jgi:hypothetical protein